MIFRIPRDKHYSRPWRFGLWWRRKSFTWVVKFNESCRYDLGNDDQYDTNKLVGIGYLPHHHKDSARFGWRYWTERGEIELSAYCYVNGRRLIQHIGFCKIDKWYRIELFATRWAYHFRLMHTDQTPIGDVEVKHNHTQRLQFGLWPYFGGQAIAPHEMKIQMEKT